MVTDAICAQGTTCTDINTNNSSLGSRKDACDGQMYCIWQSATGLCALNRDAQNNVCVPAAEASKVNPNCHDITQGNCPLNWQVRRGCCAGDAGKYDGKLKTQNDTVWVCCNTPCESLALSTVSQPGDCSWANHPNVDQCGPGGQSLLGVDSAGVSHVPSLERSYTPDHVSDALGLSPPGPVTLGQIKPGYSATVGQLGMGAMSGMMPGMPMMAGMMPGMSIMPGMSMMPGMPMMSGMMPGMPMTNGMMPGMPMTNGMMPGMPMMNGMMPGMPMMNGMMPGMPMMNGMMPGMPMTNGMMPGMPMMSGMAMMNGMPMMPGMPMLQEVGVNRTGPKQTEEVTVDDVMNLLIESLATDDDMFEYKAEVDSDPWFGKLKYGGLGDAMKFVDPSLFINQLYSTPYGLTAGNWQAGAQNIPLPQPGYGGMMPGALPGYPGALPGSFPGLPGMYPGYGSGMPFGFTQPPQPQPPVYQPQQPSYSAPQPQPTAYQQQQPAPQPQQPSYQAPQQQQPTYQAPQPQQPSYQAPQQQQPTYQAPQPQQPSYQPAQPQQPAYQPPQQPAYQPPQPQQPAYQPPQPQQPAYQPPQPQQPAYQPPQPQQPAYQPPKTAYQPPQQRTYQIPQQSH